MPGPNPGGRSQLLADYSFERLAGRRRGEEDPFSHYRKGVAGDWRSYFDRSLERKLAELTDDVVARLGYE